jgi:hypothetical protein
MQNADSEIRVAKSGSENQGRKIRVAKAGERRAKAGEAGAADGVRRTQYEIRGAKCSF